VESPGDHECAHGHDSQEVDEASVSTGYSDANNDAHDADHRHGESDKAQEGGRHDRIIARVGTSVPLTPACAVAAACQPWCVRLGEGVATSEMSARVRASWAGASGSLQPGV
jgi:hypothetical protein